MPGRYRQTRTTAVLITLALLWCGSLSAQERLPPIPAEKMTEAQKKAAATFAAARNSAPTGPFAVLLRVPELMELGFRWREHVQFRSTLEPRLTELVILVTARHLTQQYEWNAHYQAALKAGLTPETITAIADGRRPERMVDDEAILYEFCMELQRNHSVSDATYARALGVFGEAGVVEAASIAGYYALIGMVMNVARPLSRPGHSLRWRPFLANS